MSKDETIAFFDQVIGSYEVNIIYGVEGYGLKMMQDDTRYFRIETSKGPFDAKVLTVAIGVLGRPNKPKEYIGDLTVSKTGGFIITAFNSAARAIKRIDKMLRAEPLAISSSL